MQNAIRTLFRYNFEDIDKTADTQALPFQSCLFHYSQQRLPPLPVRTVPELDLVPTSLSGLLSSYKTA